MSAWNRKPSANVGLHKFPMFCCGIVLWVACSSSGEHGFEHNHATIYSSDSAKEPQVSLELAQLDTLQKPIIFSKTGFRFRTDSRRAFSASGVDGTEILLSQLCDISKPLTVLADWDDTLEVHEFNANTQHRLDPGTENGNSNGQNQERLNNLFTVLKNFSSSSSTSLDILTARFMFQDAITTRRFGATVDKAARGLCYGDLNPIVPIYYLGFGGRNRPGPVYVCNGQESSMSGATLIDSVQLQQKRDGRFFSQNRLTGGAPYPFQGNYDKADVVNYILSRKPSAPNRLIVALGNSIQSDGPMLNAAKRAGGIGIFVTSDGNIDENADYVTVHPVVIALLLESITSCRQTINCN